MGNQSSVLVAMASGAALPLCEVACVCCVVLRVLHVGASWHFAPVQASMAATIAPASGSP